MPVLFAGVFLLATSSAGSLRAGAPAQVTEVSLPKGLANPHSPFWLTTEILGLITENRGGIGGIYTFDVRSKEVRQVFGGPAFYPGFLAQHRKIFFVAPGGKDQGLTLYTVSLDGKNIKEYDFGVFVFAPSWSPDGKKVVFGTASHNSVLGIATIDRGEVEAVSDESLERETTDNSSPDWAPNGLNIVFAGLDRRSQDVPRHLASASHLYRFDVRGRRFHRLTTGAFQDDWPAYSPDGMYIAFVSNRSGNRELWVIKSNGTGLRRLTDVRRDGYQVGFDRPAWRPDQKRIAFSAIPVGGESSRRSPYEGSTILTVGFR